MKRSIIVGLVLVCLLVSSCSSGQDFDKRLKTIVRPYLFSIAGWELKALPQEIIHWLFGEKADDEEVQTVIKYFDAIKRMKSLRSEIIADTGSGEKDPALLEAELLKLQEKNASLAGRVADIIERQIRETLVQQGVFNPLVKLKISFPPVNFRLEQLPCVLVISPREKIESIREIVLEPDLTLKEKTGIESQSDKLGVSSLVVEIGGIATYPPLVDSESSLRFTLDSAIEEWVHHYLGFTPLGFRYVLDLTGLSRNYEVATMNEALAGMVSEEIGSMVHDKYYPGYENGEIEEPESGFDFNREMREIRKTVDEYLVRGEIETAESYMEQKRQYMVSKGYYIRKLNQAYFAFHGTYADEPTSVSPIGLELKELRSQSVSLKDFLITAAGMTSRQDLIESISP